MARTASLSAALLFVASIAAAQEAPQPRIVTITAATSSARLIGIGDGGVFTPGLAWQFGIQFQPHHSRLGLRLNNWFYDEQFESSTSSLSRRQAFAFGVDASYDLTRGRTRSYLLAGAGRTFLYASPRIAFPGARPDFRAMSNYGSLGFGVTRKTGPVWLFGEVRYTRFQNGGWFGDHTVPLSFGLRL